MHDLDAGGAACELVRVDRADPARTLGAPAAAAVLAALFVAVEQIVEEPLDLGIAPVYRVIVASRVLNGRGFGLAYSMLNILH